MKPFSKNPPPHIKLALILIYFSLFPLFSFAQSCSVSDECLDLEDSEYYTVIETEPNTPLSFSSLITNGFLLSATNAASTAQKLIVCGQLNMDLTSYTFASGSEIVFVSNASGMKILDDSYLQMRGTHVHGCNRLWDKILIVGGGRLDVIQGSKIEDAVRAVEIQPDGVFSSSLSEFDGNYVSIFAGHFGVPKTLAGFSIYGTVFRGSKTLIQSYTDASVTYSKPRIGIDVNYLASLQIAGGPDSGVNYFLDFQPGVSGQSVYAVKTTNSNVNISNCAFTNIGTANSSSKGYGIYCSSLGTNVVNVTGFGGESGSGNTFTNVYTALEANSTGITFADCRVVGAYKGVVALRVTGTPLGTIRTIVKDSRFENLWLSGVEVRNIFPSKLISVTNNTFLFDVQNELNLGLKTGVYMRNNNLSTPAPSATISGNTIIHSAGEAGGQFKGIELINLTKVTVNENTITDDVSSASTAFQGILCTNSPGIIVTNNAVEGKSTSYSGVSIGISNEESNNTTVLCNTVDESEKGISFNGFNCDATDFQSNYMTTHSRGLYLENNTVMGEQVEKFNRWAGSTGQEEGCFNFVGFDENYTPHEEFVGMSKFFINTFNESSNRWANPRSIDAYDDSGHLWFDGSSEVSFGVLCGSSSRTLTEMNNRVIGNTFDAIRGITATEWEAKYHTYSRLTEFPDLRPASSAADTWYSSNSSSSFAVLSDVQRDMMELWSYSSSSATDEETLLDLIEERNAKEAEWVAETNPVTKATLFNELDSLNQLVILAQGDLDSEAADDDTDMSTTKSSLITTLGSLYMATTHEDNMQTVLGILLATDGGTTGFTSLQEGYLESVAEQCRLEGGYAVVLARIALDTEVDYSSIDEVCGEADDRSKKEGEASEINAVLVTNPAHDNIAIRWSIPVTDATISLWDMTGRKVDEWNIADQKYFNAPVAATPGIYFLQINSQGLVTETHKIIIH